MKSRARSGIAQHSMVVIACGLALLAAGCGSSTSSASSTPPPTASVTTTAPNSVVCADAAALRTSLEKFRNVTVTPNAANEISADLKNVQSALNTLVSDAGDQWKTQTDALQSALSKLKAAVSELAANPSGSTVSAVVTAFGNVSTAAQNLLAAVNTDCPATSASASP